MNKKNLHQVVNHLLARHGERIAIEDDTRSCSYGELSLRSSALCARLREAGIGRGDVVALPMPASIDYVVALLAVVQCGAIFMPVDAAFPPERLRAMLKLAAPRAVVGNEPDAVGRIADMAGGAQQILLDRELPAETARAVLVAGDDDTGYLIATSGSTGEPKLIAGRNKGISHFVHWEVAEFGIDDSVRASFLAPPTFDVSLREIFVPLLAGGTLVIPAPEVRGDARRLALWLRERRISLVHCVPSLLRLLTRAIAEGSAGQRLPDLQLLAIAGEPLYGADVAAWRSLAGGKARMVNLYGPSETTLAKAFHRIGDDIAPNAIVPLGQPIANTALLILRDGRLCEIGEIGELYVSTPFASNGYWGRPDLTEQAFVANPLADDATQRIYRTGDLGRYRADRSVEFAGRSDRQVKVNGVRIELAEVEIAMRSEASVTEAVAHTFRMPDGENSLVGYYTADAALDPMVLRESMSTTLPAGMLPGYLLQLPEFPRNLNGKIDRRALPRPQALVEAGERFAAPEGEVEQEIAAMWAQALGLERVGATSAYLLIGGNSLRAIGLIGRIGQRFQVDLTIRDFFDTGTVRSLAARISARRPARAAAIARAAEQATYPLTEAQAGLWLLDRIDGAATLYNNVEWLELQGELNPQALQSAFAALIERHESLRTAFELVDGEPRQRILPSVDFSLRRESAAPGTGRDRVLELLQQERAHRFDLARGELLRVHLVVDGMHASHLVINMHHIACDGWSMGLLVRELVAGYQAVAGGNPPAAQDDAGARMRDLACWLAQQPEQPARADTWRSRLADAGNRAVLPADPDPDVSASSATPLAAGRVTLTLEGEALALLRSRLASQGATPFMAVAAALAVLLYRYGASETVVIGTPLAGRSRSELAGTVGFTVNTLPLVLRLFPGLRFTDLLERARQGVEDLADGEFDTPGKWVQPAHTAADPSRNPFYDVVLAMEPPAAALALAGLRVLEHEVPQPPARNDLSLRLQDGGATLTLNLEYRRSLYRQATMESLLEQLARLLDTAIAQPELALERLQMLGQAQLGALGSWAQGPSQPLPDTTIHQAFARRLAAHPEATALVGFDHSTTYAALGRRADRIAAALRCEGGVQPGDVVGVLLERGPDWPATLLAILKTGAVYLPLDPWHPAARHAALLQDAGARLLVADAAVIGSPCPVLGLATVTGLAAAAPEVAVAADAPAYLIYTSGSTGTPKGVLVSHRAFLNMIEDQIRALDVGPADTVLQFVSPAFDVSMFEIFLALLSGGRLALAERRRCNAPDGFAEAVARLGVSVAAMTPGFLSSLGDLPLPGLRLIVSGGEAPIEADVRRRLDAGIRVVNAYGPTEAAVCAAFHEIDADRPLPRPVPIGRPTANTELHVVAPDLSPLPVGAIGELAIAGASLADGYFRLPSATDLAFVTGSLATGAARLYRTGDRVRRLANGDIVFVGRKDGQLKIRGHRVESGEVEDALRRQPGVRDARVLARSIGLDAELVAYWTGSAGTGESVLRDSLAQQLPEYMVPRRLHRLETLPLNANGKLDPARLPPAEPAAGPIACAAPRNAEEQQLAQLFGELLGGPPSGRDDNFFELGGRSLAANRLALRAARALGVPVELRDVYAAPTPAGLAQRLRDNAGASDAPPRLPESEPGVPSPMQRRLWVIDQLGDSGSAYHIAGLLALTGRLDVAALRLAFEDLAARHAVLRTRLVARDGEPRLVCDPPGPLPWIELTGPAGAPLQQQLEHAAAQPFSLARDWPVRVVLAHEGPQRWKLLIVLHHIAADGWSMPILEAELAQAYAARCGGTAPAWTPLPAQYRDLAAWMDQRLAAGAYAADRDYWLDRMATPLPALELPTDRPRPAVRRFQGSTLEHALRPAAVEAARHCAQAHGVTLFTVLLGALQALLYRLSGQDDLVIGVPVAGRQHPASEGLIGFFVNTLPVRDRIAGSEGFATRLAVAAQSMRDGLLHQNYPFDRLVGDLQLERDPSRSALFDVMIGLDETGAEPAMPGVSVEAVPLARRGSRCDLAWMFGIGDGSASLRLEFDTDLFDSERIDGWIRRYENLLCEAAKRPLAALDTLELLDAAEREALLRRAGAQAAPLPQASIIELFEAQAAAHEERLALRTDAACWSYGDLNRAANRLARKLQRLRQAPQAPVALLCGRGAPMVIAQLAVMKCGAAYLPIEPDAPRARIELLLADSGAEVLLYEPGQAPPWLLQEQAALPVRQLVTTQVPPQEESGNLAHGTGLDHPIYVMYTSGSTGRPKGVVALHRGVVRLVQGGLYYAPQSGDRLLQLSNYAFDGASFDFYAALTNGLTLCIPDQDVLLDPGALAAFVLRHDVNVSFITTALFNRVVDDRPELLARFRRLYFGGQDASLPHVRRAHAAMAPGSLVHVYGPTECTTFATWHTVTPADLQPGAHRLPIGRPVGHTRIHVLDPNLMLVPYGTPGELCIGGSGLARGYLGQAQLTAQRFVASPFDAGERLYRSGDQCVQRPDGTVEFLGRIDGQVKVRGFRVEPGEIEHHLTTHPAVRTAHVQPRRNASGNVELVAYLTAAAQGAPSLPSLLAHLETNLPRYMVPAHFVLLDALPLNRNGKVDAAALPPPEAGSMAAPDAHGPAAQAQGGTLSATERVLLDAWCAVLGRDGIGVHDNYYAIGGDSIQAIQIGARLRNLGYSLKVTDLLRFPTIAQLAPLLGAGAARRSDEPIGADGELALTPIQHWMMERKLPAPSHFNQSILLRFPAGTDAARVQQALAALEAQHAALRLRFGIGADGQPWQRVETVASGLPELPVHDCRGADGAQAMQDDSNRVQRSLAPETGPLWRAVLYRLDDGDRLLLTVHHWAVDGVSWRILLEDFSDAFEQARDSGAAIRLAVATDSFARWSRALATAAGSPHFTAQAGYWQRQASAAVGQLPRLREAAASTLAERLVLDVALDEAQTDALFGACHAAYRTRSDELLLAAWVHALTRVQGHPACRLLLESHGRDLPGEPVDVGRTVGWFTAIYPLVFALEGDDWHDHIRQVKETLRSVPDHGIGFGLLRHLAPPAGVGPARAEVVFNYLGRFDHRRQPMPMADESTGDELDPRIRFEQGLDVSAEVRDGRLRLRLCGDTARHPASCFHALQQGLAQALEGVIAHCRSPQAGGLSPSDVDLDGIGIDDLDGILDSLEAP